MANPRELDQDLIDAYLARRALDYLFGFTLSPVLWRKLPGAKSAGRVQSVALRLIVEREREIELFVAQEYWSVVAHMQTTAPSSRRGWSVTTARSSTGSASAKKAPRRPRRRRSRRAASRSRTSRPSRSTATRRRRSPPRPCSRKRRASSASRRATRCGSRRASTRTGAITYMRTDGVQMAARSDLAPRAARSPTAIDAGYLPEKPRIIRPRPRTRRKRTRRSGRPISRATGPARATMPALRADLEARDGEPDGLGPARADHRRAGRRRPAGTGCAPPARSCCSPASSPCTRKAATTRRGRGRARLLPRLREGDAPAKMAVDAEQHFTQPPPRFSEASLVKRMEELGIGRPSTYASTLQTLKDRDYVRLEKNRFFAEESGRLLTAFLERFFERYVSLRFHRRSRGRARRHFRRPDAVADRCSKPSGGTSSRRPPR